MRFDILKRFSTDHKCDGQTDGRTDGPLLAIARSNDPRYNGDVYKHNCRPAGCRRNGGIGVSTGDLLQHWDVQHGRTLHRKELQQAQVRGGMSATADLPRLQPRQKHEPM